MLSSYLDLNRQFLKILFILSNSLVNIFFFLVRKTKVPQTLAHEVLTSLSIVLNHFLVRLLKGVVWGLDDSLVDDVLAIEA